MVESQLDRKHKKYDMMQIALLTIFFRDGIITYILSAISLFGPSLSKLQAALSIAVVCILVAFYTKTIAKKIRATDAFMILIFALLTANCYIIYSYRGEYINTFIKLLWTSTLPMYFVGLLIDFNGYIGKHQISFAILRLSQLSIVVAYAYSSYYLSTGRKYGLDEMHLSYTVLPYAMISIYAAFRQKKIIDVALAIVATVYILMLGTRGPLVCLLFFILVYYFFFHRKGMSKVLIIIFLATALIYIASASNYDDTLMWLRDKFKSIGFSTRILDMLLNDEFVAFTNGRTDIRTIAMSFITRRPFFGWGFFSEYAVTGIAYSHNFVVDLMFEYGIPIGVSIFIFILARVHKSLTLLRGDRDQQVFMLMLFSVGIVKLMLSGTYLTEGYLFMLLGFCAKTVRDRKSIIRSDRRYLAMAYR